MLEEGSLYEYKTFWLSISGVAIEVEWQPLPIKISQVDEFR